MTVAFIGAPQRTEHRGVICRLVVDGHVRLCHFTDQALTLVDGTDDARPLKKFHTHRDVLLPIAAHKLRTMKNEASLIHVYSDDVRSFLSEGGAPPATQTSSETAPVGERIAESSRPTRQSQSTSFLV